MKIPLDHICVKSGVLCPRCRRLIESGVVDQAEVKVMKALIELEDLAEFRFLKDSTYIKSFFVDSTLVVLMNMPQYVSQADIIRLARALSKSLGDITVRIVKQSADTRSMVSSVLAPARILGIDTVWSPDGSVYHVVRIPKQDVKLLPANIESLEKLLSRLLDSNFRIKPV